jgi:hypothetical protein
LFPTLSVSVTVRARDSNFELTFNRARLDAPTSMANRTRLSSITNWIIPPDSMKWSMSATVKTLEPFKVANTEGRFFFSDALMNKT